MSFVNSIINSIQVSSLAGGGYLGYKTGYPIWKNYIAPRLTTYYNVQWLETITRISEKSFFSIMGSACGVYLGYQFWPIVLPISAIVVYNDFNDAISPPK